MVDAVNLGELYDGARRRLGLAGIDTADLDARALLAGVLDVDAVDIVGRKERVIGSEDAGRLEAALARRERREPVSRILGCREFWGLPFEITQATLDPRPDSETLIEASLKRFAAADQAAGRDLRIADLGTGSGCLLTALLKELPNAHGVAVDRSAEALGVARRNLERNDVAERATFICGDWLSAICGSFDLIVANPPYILRNDVVRLQPEVARYDPRLALDGGADGLDAYRVIADQAPACLRHGGWLVLEIGCGQKDDVSAILETAGLVLGQSFDAVTADLSGIPRCVCAQNLHGVKGEKKEVGKHRTSG